MKKLDVSQIERLNNKNICLESKWFYKDGLLEFDESSLLYRKIGLDRIIELISLRTLLEIGDITALLNTVTINRDSVLQLFIKKYSIWIECIVCRDFDEEGTYFGVFRDITYKKKSERKLDIADKKLDSLFNFIDKSAYYVDKNYNLKMLNDTAQENLADHMLCENIIGDKCYKVYAERDTVCENCKLKDILNTDDVLSNTQHFDFGNDSILLYGKRIKDEDGNVDGAFCIFSDTNEEQYFIQVHKYTNIIKDIAIRKAQLISNLSSELRSNLTVMLGYSKSDILSSLSPSDLADVENEMAVNGDRIHSLVDELLEVTEIDFSISNLNKVDFDLDFFFTELKLYIDNNINENFTVNYIASQKKELEIISTDFGKFKQIYLNLISYATASSGGGSVNVGFKTTADKKNLLYISFPSDDICEDKAKFLFDNIDKDIADTPLQEYKKLLLSTINALVFVLKLNVSARYDNETNNCIINIEYERKAMLSELESDTKVKETKLYDRILIAEDNDNNYMLTFAYLNKICKVIERAKNGIEAVELAEKNKYDAILMDIQMPQMNGYEATKIIREKDKDTLIIALTAFIMNNDRVLSKEAGCDVFIEKPISKKELLANLKRLIKK